MKILICVLMFCLTSCVVINNTEPDPVLIELSKLRQEVSILQKELDSLRAVIKVYPDGDVKINNSVFHHSNIITTPYQELFNEEFIRDDSIKITPN